MENCVTCNKLDRNLNHEGNCVKCVWDQGMAAIRLRETEVSRPSEEYRVDLLEVEFEKKSEVPRRWTIC